MKKLGYALSEQNPPEAFASGRMSMPARVEQNFALLDDAEGRCYQAMKNFSEARECFERALVKRRSLALEAWTEYAYSVFQRAILEVVANDIPREEIMELFETAKSVIQKVIDMSDYVSASDLGDMYQNNDYIEQFKGNYNKAISLYHYSLLYRKEADDKRGEGFSRARIGECYVKLGDEQFAMEYLTMAKKIFTELGDPIRIKQVDDVIKEFDLRTSLEE